MENKSIGILGCGWLGKPLAIALLNSGYTVSGTTTRAANIPPLSEIGVKPFVIELPLTGDTPDADILDFFETDLIIISIPPRRKSGNVALFLQQVESIVHTMKMAKARRAIFISSTSVYAGIAGRVTENDANPETVMSQAESLFLDEPSFDTVVLRFAGLAGPGRHPGRFLSGKKVVGGDDPVNLIHQKDCIGIITKIIQSGTARGIYNACSDAHPSRRTFYTTMANALGLPPPLFTDPQNAEHRIVVNEKLKRDLDYTFAFPDPMQMTF